MITEINIVHVLHMYVYYTERQYKINIIKKTK